MPFSVRHALREGRSGVRRVGWFAIAVSLGVAVLVALYSFQKDAADGARAEAQSLLGGDLRLQSSSAFDERVEQLLDSLSAAGAEVARGVSLASVVFAPESGASRLLQVNAVESGFPVAGRPVGDPADVPGRLSGGGGVAADPQVLTQLQVAPGDPVRIGNAELEVLGAITGVPVDLGLQWAVGPPVFMALEDLPGTGILTFGSLAQHRAWVLFPDGDPAPFLRRYRGQLRALGVSVRTSGQEAESLAAGFEELSRFLGLVGLLALLLGGIGVGSAVSVYLREKLPTMAVLRCLGARRGTLVRAYLLQTVALGAGGAALGVLAGLALQFSLPVLLRSVLPFELAPVVRLEAVAAGLLVGTWVAVLFSLLPLLGLRNVSPLAALRDLGDEDRRSSTALQAGILILLVLSLLGLAVLQTGNVLAASVLTVGLVGAVALLGLVARGLTLAARALLPPAAPFPLRQGLSGLFRPGNQTASVVIALGLGAFLMAALLVVEAGLRSHLAFDPGPEQPSLLLFDIQVDQRDGVEALLRREGLSGELVPIVPARLGAVGDEPVPSILERRRQGPSWMYRRVYRNTYSAEDAPAEAVVEGRWWGDGEGEDEGVREAVRAGAVRVSLEVELARDLGVGIGDRITWDVQGVPIPSVIASLREVEWAALQPNFFAIFEPGGLEGAPATFVALGMGGSVAARERVQDVLLHEFPNVSFLDISTVREVLEGIAGRIALVLRSMALFILGGGGIVLFASLLTTRFRRRRESALLKTLGASGATVRRVLFTEYAALGAIGGAAGVLLGGGAGHLLLRWQFGLEGAAPAWTLVGLWLGVVGLAVAVGWSVSRPVLMAPPISVLREEAGG